MKEKKRVWEKWDREPPLPKSKTAFLLRGTGHIEQQEPEIMYPVSESAGRGGREGMTGYGTHGASSRFDQKDSRMGDRGSDRKRRKRMRIVAAAVLSAFLSLSGAGIPMTGTGFVTFAVAAQTASTAKAKTASSASARVMDHALVVSFVHRDNIGSTSKMDVDALSTATVYSGPTGEKKSTIEVIRDTLKKETKAKTFAIRVKKAYSKNYSKTVDRADREIDRDTKLALKKKKVAKWKTYK